MVRLRRLVVLLTFVFGLQLTQAEEQRVTAITNVVLDGQAVPQSLWTSMQLDTQSILTVSFMCREGISTSSGVRYQVELDNGDQHDFKSQYENSKTFIGLAQGHYALVVRAQSNDSQWSAVPTTLHFSVDASQAQSFRTNLQQQNSGASVEPWWKSTVALIVLASLLVLCTVILVFSVLSRKAAQEELRLLAQQLNKAPSTAPSSVVVKEKKIEDFAQFHEITKELERFKKDNAKLSKKVLDLSKKTEELNDQNLDLAGQVDRASKVKGELEDLQRQKDDLFAIIIHDIKNPASLVKNLVDLLRGYDLNSSDTQEVMQDIIDTTTKIVSLSQELSRVMAMDQTDIQLDIEDTDTGQLVESVCRRNSSAADKKGIAIHHEVPANLPHCEIDPQKIEEVLDNLVSNAIKFSLPGTAITVRTVPTDDYLRIDVEDQGLGMSKEDTNRAFQRGMKLSARPTADEPSSGLGLWIVKRLVEAHDGKVSVKSDIGMGTTFSVYLPYKSKAAAAEHLKNLGLRS